MDQDQEPVNRPQITQIIGLMKVSSINQVYSGPCVGGWYKAWKDKQGKVWIEFRKDCKAEGFPVTTELVFNPKRPKVKPSKYNKCTYNRVKKMQSTLSR